MKYTQPLILCRGPGKYDHVDHLEHMIDRLDCIDDELVAFAKIVGTRDDLESELTGASHYIRSARAQLKKRRGRIAATKP